MTNTKHTEITNSLNNKIDNLVHDKLSVVTLKEKLKLWKHIQKLKAELFEHKLNYFELTSN